MILSRGSPQELGLKFACDQCGCIHLGESLPDIAMRDFESTVLSDTGEAVLSTLPSLYQRESDGVPEAGANTVGVVSPHGAIGNSSIITDPSGGSAVDSQAVTSNSARPSPESHPPNAIATPSAQTGEAASPQPKAVSLHALAADTPTLCITASEADAGLGVCGPGDGPEGVTARIIFRFCES